jgi:hypothetical protein
MVTVPFAQRINLRGLKEPTVSGHKLQLNTEVKYIGLNLDKGMICKAQLKNVMNKAYRAFRTCKGTSGKTQGGALYIHHGDQTGVDLRFHGLVAVGQICQQDRAH